MIMIKLGGSLFNSRHLHSWLDRLILLSQHESIMIVPGGGPFANTVRTAQQCHSIDNKYTHHMALLAMAQFGLLLLGLCQRHAKPFYYPSQGHPDTGLFIWLPDKALLAEQNIAQNWSVTADSLALWLAQQLSPQKLTLIKHTSGHSTRSLLDLKDRGIIDDAFPIVYADGPVILELADANNAAQYSLSDPEHPLTL